jgi:hypothetical protein
MDRARAMNRTLKVAGTVVGLLGGFLTAVWEIFLSPLYAGAVPLPVSPVLAIVTNLALVWFVKRVTTSTGLSLLPGVVWIVTMIPGLVETRPENVLIPSNDYMGLAAVLLGAATWALTAYRQLLFRPPAPVVPVRAGGTEAAPAGRAPGKAPSGAAPSGEAPAGPVAAPAPGAASRGANGAGSRSKPAGRRSSGTSKSPRPGGRR